MPVFHAIIGMFTLDLERQYMEPLRDHLETAQLELQIADVLYYGVVRDSSAGSWGYYTIKAIALPGVEFIALFSSLEKCLSHMFSRGTNRDNGFSQAVDKKDAADMAESIEKLDFGGFALNPGLDPKDDVVYFEPGYLAGWSEADDSD